MQKRVVINGEAYRLSPLRCKQLREIAELLLEGDLTYNAYETIEEWLPFVLESLKVKHPDVSPKLIEELTIEEFNSILATVISISGIKLTSKNENKEEEEERKTDWGRLYARLICSTSLTYRDVDEMTLSEVGEVLDYLSRNPTTAEILVAVHQVKTKRGHFKLPTEEEFKQQFNQAIYDPKEGIVSSGTIQKLNGVPEEVRANLNWAQELEAKYRKALN